MLFCVGGLKLTTQLCFWMWNDNECNFEFKYGCLKLWIVNMEFEIKLGYKTIFYLSL